MNLKPFTGPGSTPSRRRFWDKVTQAVNASQKVAGRNVSVSEHQGMGTLINVPDRTRRPSGECPICPSEESVTLTLSGVSLCEGCISGGIDALGSIIITSGSIDGTYILPGGSFSDIGCCYQLFSDNIVTADFYFGPDCSDDPIPDVEYNLQLWAGRYATIFSEGGGPACYWQVHAALRGGSPDEILVFLSTPQASFSDPFTNLAMCGAGQDTVQHPCEVRNWDGGVAAEGGTATLGV